MTLPMSELQIALIAIGVVLIAAVIAYNKWQEARFKRQADLALRSEHEDVLLHSSAVASPARVEPQFKEPGLSARAADADDTPMPSEPSDDTTVELPRNLPEASAEPKLSEAIDFLVALEVPAPVSTDALMKTASPLLARFGRRAAIEGKAESRWRGLSPGGRYSGLRIGLQLVDRSGAVRSPDLDAFCTAVLQIAQSVGAPLERPSTDAALAKAAALDAFCEQVDIQIAVHLVSLESPFAGTKLRALAEASGLALEADGRFHRRDDDGVELYVLANKEASAFSVEAMKSLSTSALTLELDVPRAAGGHQAFAQFRLFAEQLAAALNGRLVDDNRAPLDAAGFDAIAAQIAPVYDAMRAQGIPAGSALAQRLFS